MTKLYRAAADGCVQKADFSIKTIIIEVGPLWESHTAIKIRTFYAEIS
jgi:hypothetical protein